MYFCRLAKGNISPVAEFNFHADPIAAKAVMNGFECPISMSPFELCVEYTASWVCVTGCFHFDLATLLPS